MKHNNLYYVNPFFLRLHVTPNCESIIPLQFLFAGTDDPLGKRLNNSKTRQEVGWEPKYSSFAHFLETLWSPFEWNLWSWNQI